MKYLLFGLALFATQLSVEEVTPVPSIEKANTASDSFAIAFDLTMRYKEIIGAVDSTSKYGAIALKLMPEQIETAHRIDLHLALVNAYQYRDSTRFFQHAHQLYDLYKAENDLTGLARAEYKMSSWYVLLGDMEKVREHLRTAVAHLDKVTNPTVDVKELRASCLYYEGSSYGYDNEYEKSIAVGLDLVQYCLKHDLKINLANAYDLLSRDYRSLFYYSDRQHGYDTLSMAASRNMLNIGLEIEDPVTIVGAMRNMGQSHYDISQFDSAQYYFQQTFREASAVGDRTEMYHALKYQVSIAIKQGKLELVDLHFKKLDSLMVFLPSPAYRSEVAQIRAMYFHKAGRYREAYDELKHMLSIVKPAGELGRQRTAYEYLDTMAQALNMWDSAYYFRGQADMLQDSFISKKSNEEISRIRSEFELEQVRSEAALETAKSRRNMTIAALAALLLALALVTVVYRFKNRSLSTDKKLLELEHKLLRSQMNPHFTFNALGSIQKYLLEDGKSRQGVIYLAKFSKLMRQILSQSRKSFISLEEEIAALENYLSLQQLRFDQKFEYTIALDPEINSSQTLIPPMLVQPIIENAIEHGKVHTIPGGHIKMSVSRASEKIVKIVVEDNGLGKQIRAGQRSTEMKNHTSMATSIIRDRIQMIEKEFKTRVSYHFEQPESGGTRVTYQLPLLTSMEIS